MIRTTQTKTTTHVRYIAKPVTLQNGSRENPLHLGDLRTFVSECSGLPDDCRVRIVEGDLSESGRRDVTLSLEYQHPIPEVTP